MVLLHQFLVDVKVNEAELVQLVKGTLQVFVGHLFNLVHVCFEGSHHVLKKLGFIQRSLTDFVTGRHLVKLFVSKG